VDLTLHFDVNLLRGAYTILLRLYHCSTLAFLVREVNAGLFSVDEMTSREGTTHLNPKVVEEVDADSLQIDHQSYVG
jgi:hypothetical protein